MAGFVSGSDPIEKVLSRAEVISRYGTTRTGTLVFTNGCFDLLHPGHVRCLSEARRYGDHLVVALNSDYSVRLQGKGDKRPLVPERDRAVMVSSLESVDAVCLFDEATPLSLIEQLGPDVLVKGGDYHHEDVIGHEVVERRGGRVILVPFLEGYSTTDLVTRMRSRVE